ncbi:MAG: alpha/beta hydrolase family protein [Candidatus Eiseniibacteriota bacterium]
MKVRRLVVFVMLAAPLGSGNAFAQDPSKSPEESLFSGDWVGQIAVGDSTSFVRMRFTGSPPDVKGVADLPEHNDWGLSLFDVRWVPPSLSFAFPLRADTARFEGNVKDGAIDGTLRVHERRGECHLIHRMAYDSSIVRRLAGNYRIAHDRVISMGPMDEASGWLAFFDSKTLRGGILYGLSDTVFFTGPTFTIDYPIAIRADVHLNGSGNARALTWREQGAAAVEAVRLDDHVTEDVTFVNGPVRLVGTVAVPKGGGRHPAVILIHGAGRTIPTRDFGYWSSFLSGRGLAVLAFDKRGGGASTGDANTGTYEDLADDVVAGLQYLQSRSDIDPDRIGLYGMSNGGYIAPLASSRSGGRVAFIAVRSGSARRVGDNIAYEVGNDLRSEGFSEADIKEGVAIRQRVTDFVIQHPTIAPLAWDSLRAEVSAVARAPWFPWARVAWVPLVSPADSMGGAFVNKLRTEWQFDPIPYWRTVRVPVYIMLGGLDRSVPTAESTLLFRSALADAGNRDATVRVFDDGNHGLLVSRTGYGREVRSLSHYVPGFQSDLARWLEEHVGLAGPR